MDSMSPTLETTVCGSLRVKVKFRLQNSRACRTSAKQQVTALMDIVFQNSDGELLLGIYLTQNLFPICKASQLEGNLS